MSRYIDADTLKASYIVPTTTTNSLCHLYVSIEDINDAPSIDIVRCKECKWFNDEDYGEPTGWCEWHESCTFADDYCSYGEREGE